MKRDYYELLRILEEEIGNKIANLKDVAPNRISVKGLEFVGDSLDEEDDDKIVCEYRVTFHQRTDEPSPDGGYVWVSKTCLLEIGEGRDYLEVYEED